MVLDVNDRTGRNGTTINFITISDSYGTFTDTISNSHPISNIGQPPIPLPIPSRTVMPFGTPEPPQFDEINKKEDIAREEVELLVANREHTVLMQNDAKWDPF